MGKPTRSHCGRIRSVTIIPTFLVVESVSCQLVSSHSCVLRYGKVERRGRKRAGAPLAAVHVLQKKLTLMNVFVRRPSQARPPHIPKIGKVKLGTSTTRWRTRMDE